MLVVLNAQTDRGAHPGEAVEKDREERAVAQVDQRDLSDRGEEGTGLVVLKDRGLPGPDDEARAADGIGRVVGEDLPTTR